MGDSRDKDGPAPHAGRDSTASTNASGAARKGGPMVSNLIRSRNFVGGASEMPMQDGSVIEFSASYAPDSAGFVFCIARRKDGKVTDLIETRDINSARAIVNDLSEYMTAIDAFIKERGREHGEPRGEGRPVPIRGIGAHRRTGDESDGAPAARETG